MLPRKFRIFYVQTDDGWRASIYAVPGCHAEGSTKEEARTRVITALAEFFDDVPSEEIVDG